ncbi:type I restriction-modification system subunit M N-terminal domain-containing protein [Lacunimicrobium album]
MNTLELNQHCNHLCESTNTLRDQVDAADFRTYIFPLLFCKRFSDVFDEESDESFDESYARFPENHRFQIPDGYQHR